MVLGMTLSAFTRVHVIISLIAVVSGLLTVSGMARGQRTAGWTGLFLLTTVLTSVTGFLFPFDHLLPSHQVGVVSLVVLAVVLLGRYGTGLSGPWRWIYPLGCVIALYLNVFVLVVQAFQKVAFLAALPPRSPELPSSSCNSRSSRCSCGWRSGRCGGSATRSDRPSSIACDKFSESARSQSISLVTYPHLSTREIHRGSLTAS